MRLIVSSSEDIYFNLALESVLLHQQVADILVFWRSQNSVVCGKHQNVCAEVDFKFCKQQNIRIARRLSGGGTVFHDKGNINFSFIKKLTEGMERAVDYKRYLEPVRSVLLTMGIETGYSHRDDLLLDGFKISGNAQHIYQKGMMALHHGTLLYDADLVSLNQAIRSKGSYRGRSVPSFRSEVMNIRTKHDFGSTDNFLEGLVLGFEKFYGISRSTLTPDEVLSCEKVSKEKFSQESWIVGYSPKYEHERVLNWHNTTFHLNMRINQGLFEDIEIRNNDGGLCWVSQCADLKGNPLSLALLKRTFEDVNETELMELF